MSLKIEIMTDEKLRAEILDLVREQVRPVIEALLADSAPLQAAVADAIARLVARPEVAQSYRTAVASEVRTYAVIAARQEAARRAEELVAEMRTEVRKFYAEEQVRVKQAVDALIAELNLKALDALTDKVALRLAERVRERR